MSPVRAMIEPMHRTAAALAAALAVAVAGCAPATTAGTAVASSGAVAASTAPERAPSTFEDITGQGARFNAMSPRAQWAPTPTPGSMLVQSPASAGDWSCTLGPAVTGETDLGFLTAGHCADGKPVLTGIFTSPRGETSLYLGPLTDVSYDGVRDHAAVWTTGLPRIPSVTRIAGLPVAGVLADPARDLKPGVPICVSGSRAGVVCGPLRRAGGMSIVFENAGGLDGGDSGGPVFVALDGNALLVGLYRGHRDHSGVAVATALAPALRDLGAKVLTDPVATAVDADLLAPDLAVAR